MLSPADLRFAAFGLVACFASSVGQTYFIAIFGGQFREAFGLSNGAFGSIYSLATLASGLTIVWVGGLVDRVALRPFVTAVALGLAAACAVVSIAPAPWGLGLALFGLRLCGQGLMIHLAVTSIARYFDRTRGRMVSLALMGLPLAEASLPRLTVALQAELPWRALWLGASLIVLLVILPLLQLLLVGHGRRHANWLAARAGAGGSGGSAPIGKLTLLGDRRFWLLFLNIISPPFIVTWIMFHQVPLTGSKGWSLPWFAGSIAAYAAASVASNLASGFLVDRWGAMRFLPFYLLPLGLGCTVLALSDAPLACPLGLMLIGLANGANGTVTTSVWAELYGVSALGAVRAVATSIGILASAASPGMIGILIDLEVSFTVILLCSTAMTVLASALARRVHAPAGAQALAV